jgi:hypothetical protein
MPEFKPLALTEPQAEDFARQLLVIADSSGQTFDEAATAVKDLCEKGLLEIHPKGDRVEFFVTGALDGWDPEKTNRRLGLNWPST